MGGRAIRSACPRRRRTPLRSLQARKEMEAKENVGSFTGRLPRMAMLGDNIYHRESEHDRWTQENSHHSNEDGTPEWSNVGNDTGTDRVLLSNRFVYFGRDAVNIPDAILDEIDYKNGRGHRTFNDWDCMSLLDWMQAIGNGKWNLVLADPHQFEHSAARYSKQTNRVT